MYDYTVFLCKVNISAHTMRRHITLSTLGYSSCEITWLLFSFEMREFRNFSEKNLNIPHMVLELFSLCWKILFCDEMNRTDWTARDVSIWITNHVISLDSLEFSPKIWNRNFQKNHKFVFCHLKFWVRKWLVECDYMNFNLLKR